ncbi:hypothetical protein NDU88_005871 [Pleurodeles waltl]|uniref:Uncharacterized protein n=1 Tax=Pleurodeles waltl TaxID=8319 RepID=A0AAV7QH96_PLEWA|nr:hypothetical protein NDU88_005871 [Pleurodeles waltl]
MPGFFRFALASAGDRRARMHTAEPVQGLPVTLQRGRRPRRAARSRQPGHAQPSLFTHCAMSLRPPAALYKPGLVSGQPADCSGLVPCST